MVTFKVRKVARCGSTLMRQENHELQACLDYIAKPCLKNK
jgi:hypothetical protein